MAVSVDLMNSPVEFLKGYLEATSWGLEQRMGLQWLVQRSH